MIGMGTNKIKDIDDIYILRLLDIFNVGALSGIDSEPYFLKIIESNHFS